METINIHPTKWLVCFEPCCKYKGEFYLEDGFPEEDTVCPNCRSNRYLAVNEEDRDDYVNGWDVVKPNWGPCQPPTTKVVGSLQV